MTYIDNYGKVVSDELYHHGILGMKWGVRHDRYPLSASDHTAAEKKAGWRKSLYADGYMQTKKNAKIYTKQINKTQKERAKAAYEMAKAGEKLDKESDKVYRYEDNVEILDGLRESYEKTIANVKKKTGKEIEVSDEAQMEFANMVLKEYRNNGYDTKAVERFLNNTAEFNKKGKDYQAIVDRGKALIDEVAEKGYSIDSKMAAYHIDLGKDIAKYMLIGGIGATNTSIIQEKYKVRRTKDNEVQRVNVNDEAYQKPVEKPIATQRDHKKTAVERAEEAKAKKQERDEIAELNRMLSRAESMRKRGMTNKEIGKQLGISASFVSDLLMD